MIRSVTALAASTDAGAPADPGFGVYVHWPFCLSKCPYCDFNSHVRGAAIDEARYLAAFKAEIAHRAALAPRRTVRSVFFGGGTPSLMRPETVQGVIDAIGAAWRLDPEAEITLEANPTSVEAGAVSRLSHSRRQPPVDRRPGAERRRPQGARAQAYGR